MSQFWSPGPRMGRMAESMPVLPTAAGWKQDVLIKADSVRSPLARLGSQLSTGRAAPGPLTGVGVATKPGRGRPPFAPGEAAVRRAPADALHGIAANGGRLVCCGAAHGNRRTRDKAGDAGHLPMIQDQPGGRV